VNDRRFIRWICDKCGKEAGLHKCLKGKHEYYCWKCKQKMDFPKEDENGNG